MGADGHRFGDRAGKRGGVGAELGHTVSVSLSPITPRRPGSRPALFKQVQQLLGLVLEAQDPHLSPPAGVGQRDALDARPAESGVRAGTSLRRRSRQASSLRPRRHPVLEPFGLLVDLVPGDPEDIGQEPLDQAVAADGRLGVVAAPVGERERLVLGAGDVAVALEARDHLVDGRGRQPHRPGTFAAVMGSPASWSQKIVCRYSSSATVAWSWDMRVIVSSARMQHRRHARARIVTGREQAGSGGRSRQALAARGAAVGLAAARRATSCDALAARARPARASRCPCDVGDARAVRRGRRALRRRRPAGSTS